MDEMNYLNYKIQVEPPMMDVLEQVVRDAKAFGITDDQITRATYRWVMERMMNGPVPEWYFEELDDIEQNRHDGGSE